MARQGRGTRLKAHGQARLGQRPKAKGARLRQRGTRLKAHGRLRQRHKAKGTWPGKARLGYKAKCTRQSIRLKG